MKTAVYRSCCTDAGGVWSNGYCKASTPISCSDMDAIFNTYDTCVKDVAGYTDANLHYRSVSCN